MPPSRSPISSSKASQPGVPSSRAYSRTAAPSGAARKFEAGTTGTLSGRPGRWSPRPRTASRVSTRRFSMRCTIVHSWVQQRTGGATWRRALVNRVVGERVRGHRSERGWTLDDLAARSGVSRRMVVNIEQGVGNPSIATLLRIGDALGVGLPALVDVERRREVAVTAAGARAGAVARDRTAAGRRWSPAPRRRTSWSCGTGTCTPARRTAASRTAPARASCCWCWRARSTSWSARSWSGSVAGDSATFAGDVVHGYAAADAATAPARFALTVFQPHVGGAGR